MKASPTELRPGPWVRESEYRFVHRSGVVIERRGFPHRPGWFLVPVESGQPTLRFAPTPQGCDDALRAYSGRIAVTDRLTRIVTA
ncbi:MAG TPA: hypothetical protein VKU80_02025 [Planctomycetota bacterium]|nr:hypothetical protein [Planctomycetota bacterium]